MFEAISTGALLGLAAGLTPGPLTLLVISSTLRYSAREGCKAALAPLFTDVPIIIMGLYLVGQAARFDVLLAMISLAGAVFVFHLAVDNLRFKGLEIAETASQVRSIRKGVLVNFLSPHPYLFWLTVGVPQILKFSSESWTGGAAFGVSFLFCLVGTKIPMAILSGKARSFISGRPYVYIMRVLGALLLGFAILLLKDGLSLLGII
jgi:threonine/homoserine/homoserine lactone efflux protein